MGLGRMIGRLGYVLARGRKHTAEVNLNLCFPEWPQNQRRTLLREHFLSLGMGLMETATAWLRKPDSYEHRFHIEGIEYLREAAREGKGVILIGFHFTTMDICAAVLSTQIGMGAMYRKNKNPVLDYIMKKGRNKNLTGVIEREDIKGVIKFLRNGGIIWYGPDQDYGRKHSIFAPFFGVNAATIQATSRLARISASKVVVFTHYRQPGNNSYVVRLSPPLENYPGDNMEGDARTINELAENAIMEYPEQYWWIHRRFKTRPAGESRPY